MTKGKQIPCLLHLRKQLEADDKDIHFLYLVVHLASYDQPSSGIEDIEART